MPRRPSSALAVYRCGGVPAVQDQRNRASGSTAPTLRPWRAKFQSQRGCPPAQTLIDTVLKPRPERRWQWC